MQKERETENFVRLGADLKEARKVLGLSRRTLAEMVNITPRYLANIENSGNLSSLPVFYQLVKICKLPVERYFFPPDSEQYGNERERVALKLELCPKEYLPIIEVAIDGAINLKETEEV
ncbi:TPA: helix-turn-helix domain-containing protein [Clostridioides difficile]|uniref:helix-turn-helix domain-containing protein n=1 Tax=Clostridioides difficile TaxID=1496 RepID=UPI00097FFDB4|nr:helix-turn-helix domain-containing protein [Clostridioides difficile]SJO39280.1 anaerobic benzoate catabolism transcriptional regulator [Clostridioides difficile]SJP52891.1 anaerobic benzoate catabolism transcriptional regulator [Clostridioides difficile]HBF6471470.1 helix-turn-helix domain-containing protein [Clostridioides difficile]HBG4071343.1 helix-turn-helix domain-containing protein [Clostridioides difficile]HBH3655103.1 helix-turn-helix domain-containing protein [Clostridioides diff